MAGQPNLFDSVDLAPDFEKFSNSGKIAILKEKSDQFTRMAGQPHLFDFVDLAQISKISQNPGKWPV